MATHLFLKHNEVVSGDYQGTERMGDVDIVNIHVAGAIRKIPQDSILWQSNDASLINSMYDGTLQIKNAETWWLAFMALCATLDAYGRKAGTADVVKEIRCFRASLPTDVQIINTLADPCNRVKNIVLQASRLVHDLWAALPDSPSIHSLPRWDLLCDLCSENYHVLDLE